MNPDQSNIELHRTSAGGSPSRPQAPRAWESTWKLVRRAVIMVALLAGGFLLLDRYSGIRLTDPVAVRDAVESLGAAGPILVVGLIAAAIVMTPVPSAPIALAAGAAYGHVWGTLYVALGAEIGALAAFGIARYVAYEAVMARFGARLDSVWLLRSQNTLMAIVFATRLVPFISFDFISYAAGLTHLAAWRFALATLLGILPASFVLAHIGGEITSADPTRVVGAVLALGLITGAPLVLAAVKRRWMKRKRLDSDI